MVSNTDEPRTPSFRIKILIAFFFTIAIILLVKLFTWQVVRADELSRIAKSQHQVSNTILAHRGLILSSDGFPLVSSSESWLVWASLPDLENLGAVAASLAPIFVDLNELEENSATPSAQIKPTKKREELLFEEEERIKSLLARTDVVWVPLKRNVGRDSKAKIEKLNFAGIGFDAQEARSYPEGTMAAHLLGFVGKDAAGQDKGYFGLEGYYDLTLSGTQGEKSWEKDAFGNPILLGSSRQITALDGLSLKTNIDRSIQYIVQKHLEESLEKYGASSGTVIVTRPSDGAILAMASLPSYDPAKFSKFDKELYVNPAVGESFEPGSIFKVIVMSAALDSGSVEPLTQCEACSGPRRIAEYTLKTWDEKYYPNSTMTEIIQYSNNVGMIWVAEQMGEDTLYEYLERFGIGQLTKIDLQDEAGPVLRPKKEWGLIDLATTSFGQGIAVTPIQMVQAVSAIANKGRLFLPQVVDKVIGQGWEQDIEPEFGGRVISEESAREITEMMVTAAESGEAQWTAIRGFRIAGKTGTAQIPVRGHYDEEKTIASFVGFAPADEAKFAMIVTLREPESSPWASETAAPLWFAIAEDLFPYMGIQPE